MMRIEVHVNEEHVEVNIEAKRFPRLGKTLLWALLLMLMPIVASAQATWCLGKLGSVALDADGGVLISLAGVTPIHTICNTVSQGSFRVQTPACKSMYAALLAARMSDHQVRVYYNDPAITSCSEIANWSVQKGFYFVEVP